MHLKKMSGKVFKSIKLQCLIPVDALLHLESCDRDFSLSSDILQTKILTDDQSRSTEMLLFLFICMLVCLCLKSVCVMSVMEG